MKKVLTVLVALALAVLGSRSMAGSPPSVPADVDFVKEIKPILERSCLKCHGPEKPKGGLRLDTLEALNKGAKSGKIVVAGNAEESRLYEVITLDKDDPDRMPNEGEPLNKLEQELIRDWINQGLKWPENLVLTPPAGAKKAEPEVDPGLPISDAEKAAVAAVQKKSALALRLAQNTNLLRVDFSLQGKEVQDEDLAVLNDMDNLVELSLGNTQVTDAGLANLKPLSNLTRLQLHKTKVTDAGLENLKGMQKLTSLNIYGTDVTDAGLEHLKELKNLKKLYVWQSKVTPEGAKKLEEAIPGLVIELGFDVKPAETAKAEEKKEEKPEEKKEAEKKEPEKKEEKKAVAIRQLAAQFEKVVSVKVEMNYLVYQPTGTEQQEGRPLLVFLHGAGERGSDVELVKKHGPPKLVEAGKEFPFVVLSPQCANGQFWRPEALVALVDEVAAKYKVDTNRIYLTGLSMGGYGTWALAAAYPDKFAAIVPICGGGTPADAAKIKHIPAWVFHGAKDPVVPLERSQEMVDALKAAGGNVKFTVYPDADHDSWTQTYDNPELYEWLLQQKRQQ